MEKHLFSYILLKKIAYRLLYCNRLSALGAPLTVRHVPKHDAEGNHRP